MQAIPAGKSESILRVKAENICRLFLMIILALLENSLLVLDFVRKFSEAFEKEF